VIEADVGPRAVPLTPRLSPRAVVAICTLAVFVVSLDTTALYVAFPAIRRDFGTTSVEQLSWVLNAYTVLYGALLVVMGRLADQLGRRRLFLFGLTVFGVTSALCALAPSPGVLIAGRALQGVGSAALVPSSLAIALDAVDATKRNMVAALWAATGALASAVGPSLGALLVDGFGWRSVLLINVPVVIFAVAMTARGTVESRDVTLVRYPRPLPVLALVLGSALLGLALVEGRAWGIAASATFASLGLASLALFARSELRSSRPSFDLGLFRARSFAVANLAMLVFGTGFAAMFLGFVLFLTQAWHYDIVRAGLAISPGPMTVVPVAILAGRLAPRVGHRSLAILGGLFTAAGGAMRVFSADAAPDFLVHWLPAAIVTGIGVGLVMPTLNAAAVGTLPKERFAVGSAIHQALRQLGSVLGVALAILLSTTEHPFESLFGAAAISGVLTAVIASALPRPGEPLARRAS
jgi:EmrB/QacA subfamily drug resistance transporter